MNSAIILKTISEIFEVPVEVIKSRTLQREVVGARFVVWHYLIRELGFSPQRVGRILSRHRSNYHHSLQAYDALYETDRAFRRKADAVASRLGIEKEVA